MKGLLKKTETGNWVVLYTKHHPTMIVKEWNSSLPLHPECVKFYYLTDNDNRTNVEFEIVKEYTDNHTNQVQSYAKLIKQNELMDDVDKLSWEYSPVKKLDHEFIRAAFKAGYNKARQTMYSEEDLLSAFEAGMMFIGEDKGSFREWFEQFKKGEQQ
jgi:hypothetical protein